MGNGKCEKENNKKMKNKIKKKTEKKHNDLNIRKNDPSRKKRKFTLHMHNIGQHPTCFPW